MDQYGSQFRYLLSEVQVFYAAVVQDLAVPYGNMELRSYLCPGMSIAVYSMKLVVLTTQNSVCVFLHRFGDKPVI